MIQQIQAMNPEQRAQVASSLGVKKKSIYLFFLKITTENLFRYHPINSRKYCK